MAFFRISNIFIFLALCISIHALQAQTVSATQSRLIQSSPGSWLSTRGIIATPRVSYDPASKNLILDNVGLISNKPFSQAKALRGSDYTQELPTTPPQATPNKPIHWRILIDVSYKEQVNRMEAQLKYARSFIKSLPDRDACSVILFGGKSVILEPTATNDSQRNSLLQTLESRRSAIPRDRNLTEVTLIYSAILEALDTRNYASDMSSRILILSDGLDETKKEDQTQSRLNAINRAKETGTVIYSVGFWSSSETQRKGAPTLSFISAETGAGSILQTAVRNYKVNDHAEPQVILERANPYTASLKVDVSSLVNLQPTPSVRITVTNGSEAGIITIDSTQIKSFFEQATPAEITPPPTPAPPPTSDVNCISEIRTAVEKIETLKEQLRRIAELETHTPSFSTPECASTLHTTNELLNTVDALVRQLRAIPSNAFTSSEQSLRSASDFTAHEALNTLVSLINIPANVYQKSDILKALNRNTPLPELPARLPASSTSTNSLLVFGIIAAVILLVGGGVWIYLINKRKNDQLEEEKQKRIKEREEILRQKDLSHRLHVEEINRIAEQEEQQKKSQQELRLQQELELQRARSAQLTDLATQQVYYILGSQASVGRSSQSNISLSAYSHVSSLHCVLQRSVNGEWLVTDNDSANGLYVNGIRVTQKVIRSGDTIGLGASDFLFQSYPPQA